MFALCEIVILLLCIVDISTNHYDNEWTETASYLYSLHTRRADVWSCYRNQNEIGWASSNITRQLFLRRLLVADADAEEGRKEGRKEGTDSIVLD